MIWTIDTWVLVRAEGDEDQSDYCKGFLTFIAQEHLVALNEEIIGEYKASALHFRTEAFNWFYEKIWNKGKYEWLDSPEAEEAHQLRLKLNSSLPGEISRFDSDDIPFVVLCFRTEDRHLISGDVGEGDYSISMTSWLHREFGICFHDLAGAHPWHSARHECTRKVL